MRPGGLAALAVAAAVVGGLAGDAGRAAERGYPGANGAIAFVRVIAGPSPSGVPLAKPPWIYVVSPDGVGARPLTTGFDYDPAWSPDGTLLAFSRVTSPTAADSAQSSEIFAAAADGSGVQRLTTNGVAEKSPTWSPDGSRLAFAAEGAIWTMRADGSDRRLVIRDALAPSWSPNGRWIAYSRDASIEIVRPDGTGRRRVAQSSYYGDKFGYGESVEWTPDGRIAFVGDDLVVRTRTVDVPGRRRVAAGREPAWSPDGQWVAMTVWGRDEPFSDRLDIVAADGGRRRALTESVAPTSDFQPDWQPVCHWLGGPARDVIVGSAREELLCGAGGGDFVRGGGGRDRLFGGDGNDRIVSDDRQVDVIGCGAGSDRVVADRRDLVGGDCERVTRR